MIPEEYLRRIGIEPSSVGSPDLETLRRICRAHVMTVPFENLDITGGPEDEAGGPGVSLSVPDMYEKIVERGRGGYCFELNGLFHWLLDELGYDIDRVAARMTNGNSIRVPANHHSNIVYLDRRYVVDVGMGRPKIRRPVPLDGSAVLDDAGVEWRVIESERPDATYSVEFRYQGNDEWTQRYIFEETPRDLSYFEATNDYLQCAPESPFTGSPVIFRSTDDGLVELQSDTFIEYSGAEKREKSVSPEEWFELLEEQFGIRYVCE